MRLLDGAGDPKHVQEVAPSVVPADAEIVVVGNADAFDYEETEIRYHAPGLKAAASRLRAALGRRPSDRRSSPDRRVRCHHRARNRRVGAIDLAEQQPRDETRQWAVTAARAADSKQGADVVVLEVGEVLALCGWFVIASAANERQVKAICDEVELQIHQAGGPKPKRIEGLQDRLWVLMDYGDVVVHVFQQDQREFYDLERLWSDVPRVDWSESAA